MDSKTAELIELYIEEANEHLQMMEEDLLTIKNNGSAPELIDNIYRGAHSIKGAAGFFHFSSIISLSHAIEETLSKAKEGLKLEDKVLDCFFECIDILSELFKDVHNSNDYDISEYIEKMKKVTQTSPPPAPVEIPVAEDEAEETEPLLSETELSPFQLSQFAEKISSLANSGYLIFSLEVNPAADLAPFAMKCTEFFALLESLGEIIAVKPDKNKLLNQKKWQKKDRFKVLFASVMEAELVSHAMEIPPEKIKMEDSSEFRREIKLPLRKTAAPEDPLEQIQEEKQPNKEAEKKQIETAVTNTEPAQKKTVQPAEATKTTETRKPEKVPAPPAEEKSTPPDNTKNTGNAVMRDETLRVKVAQLNKLVNMAGELVLGRNQLLRAAESLSKSTPGLGTIVKRLGIVISDLQEQIMNTRMQPISTVFGKFPRVVRDLEKIVGKKIELTMEGNEIELDKSIIEALADPLTHLVRNVADHGLENEAERLKNDKPPHGNVCLKAFHESGHVIVEVSDDGRGVDGNKVGVKALEKGLVTPQHLAAISEHEKIQMIFLPGFSTKDAASSLSGRGVGMDVVKTNIEKLGGTVDIQSTIGKGTTVRMTLPLTLAIVSSLIFRLKERSFIIPQVNIDEMVSIEPSEINNKIGWVQNQNVLKLRGRLMPLVRLAEILGCHDRFTDIMDENELRAGFSLLKLYKQAGFNGSVRIIVVRIGNSELGLIVDEISGIEEIVVKPIPEYLKSLGWYSGCTILGSGQVALIIDVLEIMKQQQISLSENITGTEVGEEVNDKGRNVYLLTFSNGTEEKFALPIPDILRIDHYEAEKIQRIGRREFIEHQGKVMHLLRLEEHLNIQQPENRQEDSSACLVVLKNSEPLCCIYTHKILDSKYVRIKVEENNTYGKAVKGTVLVDNKLHMLLETDGLIDCARKSGS